MEERVSFDRRVVRRFSVGVFPPLRLVAWCVRGLVLLFEGGEQGSLAELQVLIYICMVLACWGVD